MNNSDTALLEKVIPEKFNKVDAYNIRKNGKCVDRKVSQYINIEPKEDGTGIDIYVKDDTLFGIINIPVIINADFGHVPPRLTIINGAYATIVSKEGKGTIKFELK